MYLVNWTPYYNLLVKQPIFHITKYRQYYLLFMSVTNCTVSYSTCALSHASMSSDSSFVTNCTVSYSTCALSHACMPSDSSFTFLAHSKPFSLALHNFHHLYRHYLLVIIVMLTVNYAELRGPPYTLHVYLHGRSQAAVKGCHAPGLLIEVNNGLKL